MSDKSKREEGIYTMALHGGAISRRGDAYTEEKKHMQLLAETARRDLAAGESALDLAVRIVREMERSGLYVAGRGASPTAEGRYELDAAVADGRSRRAGAVAALEGFDHAVDIARYAMDETPHVLLAGEGAAVFAREMGFKPIADKSVFTHRGNPSGAKGSGGVDVPFGTVGCVVLDRSGALAAATSTAGIFGKMPGRVGDSPLIGSGTWADDNCAVSCTGHGEYFIRVSAASQLAFRLRFSKESLQGASSAVLEDVVALGGSGGLIAVSSSGEVAMPFASAGMKRAVLFPDGRVTVGIF